MDTLFPCFLSQILVELNSNNNILKTPYMLI